MPIDDLLDEAFGIKKTKIVENSIVRIKDPAMMELHPPKLSHAADALVHAVGPKLSKQADLDFNKIANSSDFQRFIVYLMKQAAPGLFTGVSTRVPAKKMMEQFNNKRGDYKLVMQELKKKLEKRRNESDEL